jgi:hypothetical protein
MTSKLQLVDTAKDQHSRKNRQSGADDPPTVESHVWILIVHQVEQGHHKRDATQQHQTLREVDICKLFPFPWRAEAPRRTSNSCALCSESMYEHVATCSDTRKPASKDVNQHGTKEKNAPICPDYPD